jgi:hypothetical protein
VRPAGLEFEADRVGVGGEGKLRDGIRAHERRDELAGEAADKHDVPLCGGDVVGHGLHKLRGGKEIGGEIEDEANILSGRYTKHFIKNILTDDEKKKLGLGSYK